MTPADLAKFNPGDKGIVSFEVEFPPNPKRTDDAGWIWVYAITGKSEEGHDIACIQPISIERVRPALPDPWQWEDTLGGVVILNPDDPEKIIARVIACVEGFNVVSLKPTHIPKEVFEAVRNA